LVVAVKAIMTQGESGANVPSAKSAAPIGELIALARAVYAVRGAALPARWLGEWPFQEDRAVDARTLPALRWLTALNTEVPADCERLVAALRRSAARLAWRQTYTAQDIGSEFLDNYAWTELIGERGPVSSHTLACGLLLLGPGTVYPSHWHAAEELYVPLSATASWQQGDGVWREQPPGTLIYHASNEPHAIRVGTDPLLAAYLWRGGDLSERSTLG